MNVVASVEWIDIDPLRPFWASNAIEMITSKITPCGCISSISMLNTKYSCGRPIWVQ